MGFFRHPTSFEMQLVHVKKSYQKEFVRPSRISANIEIVPGLTHKVEMLATCVRIVGPNLNRNWKTKILT
jgi:hypothetical protein